MNQEARKEDAHAFTQGLAEKIQSFRKFDGDFAPLEDDVKKSMFKGQREAEWAVLKRALLIIDRNGHIMMFYRHPMESKKESQVASSTPLNTYGLTSYNSILIYGDWETPFNDLAAKRIQGWPANTSIIPAGMGHAVVAGGYLYFFEVGYAIVPPECKLSIGGVSAGFVELEHAMEIMNSHGREYKEMEVNIAKVLSKGE